MGTKYIAFIPTDPRLLPSRGAVDAAVSWLESEGVVRKAEGGALTNGPNTGLLFRDTDPRKVDGGLGTDPSKMSFRVDYGELHGHAGDNLEPVACIHCNSELPYSAAQDAFLAMREGKPETDPLLTMECYHCGRPNAALEADWGRSGGFARCSFVFEGETSNRVEPNQDGIARLSAALGAPLRFVQVFAW